MQLDILTLFPEMFHGPFGASIVKRAREKGLVNISIYNIRDFANNKHRIVDDTPYGGGVGMVMKPEPLFAAYDYLRVRHNNPPSRTIILSPGGAVFNQAKAFDLDRTEHLIMICGHYEGIDERVREYTGAEELSIGDYVLTGGELAAMVVADAVIRLIPGVLGKEASALSDSFVNGLLEHPQYTKPREYRGYQVPEVLLSGNHGLIARWRRQQSLWRTYQRRPDLFAKLILNEDDRKLLAECLVGERQQGCNNSDTE